MTRRENYPVAISDELRPDVLLEVVSKRTTQWHPEIRELIRKADSTTVAVWNIRTSVPMEHWKTGKHHFHR
jgi:hypothetical protein